MGIYIKNVVENIHFQKYDFDLKAQFLSSATDILSCLPWSDNTHFSFREKYLSNTQTVGWFFLQVNMVFHDKGSWRAHSQPSTYPSSFWAPAHVCPVHSCCSTSQTMEKMSPQGTRWAEMYPLLSQGHAQAKLAVDVFVFVASMWRWRTGTVCLRLPQPWVQLTPQEAVPWPLWICQSYRQILSSVILKIVFNFTDPWEILRDSRCLPTISGVIWAQWI